MLVTYYRLIRTKHIKYITHADNLCAFQVLKVINNGLWATNYENFQDNDHPKEMIETLNYFRGLNVI
jgi:hypothetical protein